ncbi:Uncharacterized protein TCAP_00188 [Tolypocladium capitatum]|uniref:Uncharacterized protein n=1 Tax=Tolypocladium capitatum TaxID=45235 RepID=A0A2K3QQR7_9HYPO|nr:Uncharacterized protein TCAP_00188 [Tolypocladium capitatum]
MATRPCHRTCSLLLRPHLWKGTPSHSSVAWLYRARSDPPPALGQTRRYAVPRAPAPKAAAYSNVFTLAEIPGTSFESVIYRNGNSFRRLSPEQYYECAERFTEAIKQGSNPWAVSLSGSGISAEVLHELACIMRQIRGPRSADAFATAMWASASELGYRPSTLSLARQLIRSRAYGRTPQLRKVEARFKQLVSTSKDPDAMTAEGELLFEQGRFDVAVATLQRALRAGSASFEWKPYCELCLGKALLKLGRRREARTVLEALSEAGLVEADIELGDMLRASDGAKAEQHMYAAACSGRLDMFSHLSEIALEGAASAPGDGRSTEDGRRWAMEWSRLADIRAEH